SAGSPSEEGTSESAAQPCAAHRERLTIQSATACNAFSPQGEWLDRRMSNQRFEKQRQFLQNRLSPEGYAGLHLTIGVLVVLLAGWGLELLRRICRPTTRWCCSISAWRFGFTSTRRRRLPMSRRRSRFSAQCWD